MSDQPQWEEVLGARGWPPLDLLVTICAGVGTLLAATMPLVRETPIGLALTLAISTFLPGYAVVAALFPAAGRRSSGDGSRTANEAPSDRRPVVSASLPARGITGVERVALSVVVSLAVVAVLGLVLSASGWGLRPRPFVVGVNGLTLACATVATVRRLRVAPEDRFRPSLSPRAVVGRGDRVDPEAPSDALQTALLVAGIVIAVSGVGYAVMVPTESDQFTAFSITTQTDSGETVAADYPLTVGPEENATVTVSITNHEHRRVGYAVVVKLQRVAEAPAGGPVTAEDELRRLRPTVDHGETWQSTYRITPTMTGRRLRLVFLLYADRVPTTPTVDNADEDLRLWLNVVAENATGTPRR